MANNNITKLAVTVTALVNDQPRTYTTNLDLTPAQGERFMSYIQAEFGIDPITGSARGPQAMVNALGDEMFDNLKHQVHRSLKSQAAAGVAPLDTTRS